MFCRTVNSCRPGLLRTTAMRIAEIFRSLQGEGRLTGVESIFVRAAGCNLRCAYCDTPYASWTPEGEELSVAEILDRVEQLRQSPRPEFLENFVKRFPLPLGGGLGVFSPLPLGEGQGVRAEQGSGFGDSEPPNLQISKSPNQPSPHPNPLPKGEGTSVRHVVLTGGEPMLFADLVPLSARLRENGWHITIETAGTRYLPVACDLMSISPKLSNSTPTAEQHLRWAQSHTLHRHVPDVIRRLIAEYDCQLKFVIDFPADCDEVLAYLAEFPEIERSRVMLMPQGVDAESLARKAVWLKPYCAAHGFMLCSRRQIEWFGAQRGT
jgi:7-carboxy-7-deazaguanine synthase